MVAYLASSNSRQSSALSAWGGAAANSKGTQSRGKEKIEIEISRSYSIAGLLGVNTGDFNGNQVILSRKMDLWADITFQLEVHSSNGKIFFMGHDSTTNKLFIQAQSVEWVLRPFFIRFVYTYYSYVYYFHRFVIFHTNLFFSKALYLHLIYISLVHSKPSWFQCS